MINGLVVFGQFRLIVHVPLNYLGKVDTTAALSQGLDTLGSTTYIPLVWDRLLVKHRKKGSQENVCVN